MEDDNIIPYETSPTLTVKQAVMYMLGHRGEYSYVADTELMELDLYDYLYNLQEEADCAFGNASVELKLLNQNVNASPDAIKLAEGKVASATAELEKANNLPKLAEQYRQLIDHEIKRARLGKRTPLVVDEDESASTKQLRINTSSFLEWLEGMELDDASEISTPVKLPLEDDALDQAIEKSSNPIESLYLTLGLLVSLFAELDECGYGTGQKPNVNEIAKAIAEYAKQRNCGQKMRGQGIERIKDRIEPALSIVYEAYKGL